MTESRPDPSSGASSSRTTTILAEVERYYSERLAEHGPTPRGVDWNGDESQILRFRQLERILPADGPVSVNDLGCGYGALLSHLQAVRGAVDYHGCDVSPAMIETARRVHGEAPGTRFVVESAPSRVADFGMASGVFNVRVGQDGAAWRDYIVEVLDAIDRTSRRGFAFNCLTSYSDADKMRDHLYYADPCDVFDLCKRRYSRNVALLHDYGLYEFTILIRKDA
jgi:SAM-dependent methyltransferase